MSYMFCKDKTESIELYQRAKDLVPDILKDLRHFVRDEGKISIEVSSVWHGMYWSVEADLLFDGDVVRHYESFDLLELELTEWELSILMRQPGFAARH